METGEKRKEWRAVDVVGAWWWSVSSFPIKFLLLTLVTLFLRPVDTYALPATSGPSPTTFKALKFENLSGLQLIEDYRTALEW